jgi:RsiW-degrading membrane proteinase PrsW (M82 family)
MSDRTFFQVEVHEPDLREKLSFLSSGLITSVPISIFLEAVAKDYLKSVLPANIASFILITMMAPLIEEYAKVYPLFHRHAETERNIMNLAFLTGLGFGVSEFMVYVFGLGAPIVMRVPAVLFHATNASITAYGIAKDDTERFYLIAISLHFMNNFFAEFGMLWFIGGTLANLASYYIAWRLHQRASNQIIV